MYLTRSTDPYVPLDKNLTNSGFVGITRLIYALIPLEEVEVTLDIED